LSDRRSPLVDWKPSAVSGTSITISSFLATRFLAVFRRIQTRNVSMCLSSDTYSRGCCVAVQWNNCMYLGGKIMLPVVATLAARTRHRVPRGRCALELLPWKKRLSTQRRNTWLWAWAYQLAYWTQGGRPNVRQQCLS
jgi:hypothetical protein